MTVPTSPRRRKSIPGGGSSPRRGLGAPDGVQAVGASQPRKAVAAVRTQALEETPVRNRRDAGDREFLPDLLRTIETPPSPVRVGFLYAICTLVGCAIGWSYFGYLDVHAVAQGKIQPSGRTKVIQPIDPGKVISIPAKNGLRVKEGEPLLELDPAEAVATRTAALESLQSLQGEVQRRAVAIVSAAARNIPVSPEVPWTDDVPLKVREREQRVLQADLVQLSALLGSLAAQRKAKEAEKEKATANIAAQKDLLSVLTERLAMRTELMKKGWDSKAYMIDALQLVKQAEASLAALTGSLAEAIAAIGVIDTQMQKAREDFIAENTVKLSAAQVRADELLQEVAKATVKLSHMTLTSPIAGTVQALSVTTLGQFVSSGQELMQVVPEGLPLEIEAYVLNQDIGFVQVGQEAVIKVDSFPFTRYGTVSGRVTHVAADAIPSAQALQTQKDPSKSPSAASATSASQQAQDLVFAVTVVPAQASVNVDGKPFSLSPGMTVTVEIKTDKRRVIEYLLSPLIDIGSTALRER